MWIISNLCAGAWLYYAIDAAVVLFLLIMTLNSGKKGFVTCLFGVVSNLVALILAAMFCKTVLEATGGLFGLEALYAEKLEGIFAGLTGFDVDISTSNVKTALETQNVPAVLAKIVLKMTGDADVPAGTTLAYLLGQAVGSLAGMLTCGILLFIAIKLVVSILKKVLNGLIEKLTLLRGLNTLLGSAFGLLYALVIISLVLAILTVLPINGVGEFLSDTLLVSALYSHNPLIYLLSVFL